MKGKIIHKGLADGRWYELTLLEQLGNIGSEVGRASQAQDKDSDRFWSAVWRAIELFDLTLGDTRWKGHLKEIGRAKEVFCDAVYGGREYGSSLAELEQYFNYFAIAAMKNKFTQIKK
ncbi:MAG: hypothetical protein WD898_03535 [Candidatus Paceibacterota bacterium]